MERGIGITQSMGRGSQAGLERFPGTFTLPNMSGADTAEEAAFFARAKVRYRLLQPMYAFVLSADGFRAIHHYLFQDVYSWAGELRIKPMGLLTRSIETSDTGMDDVHRKLELVFATAQLNEKLAERPDPIFCVVLADAVVRLDAMHLFLDGNKRTLLRFMVEFAKLTGRELDMSHIKYDAYVDACKLFFPQGRYSEAVCQLSGTIADALHKTKKAGEDPISSPT